MSLFECAFGFGSLIWIRYRKRIVVHPVALGRSLCICLAGSFLIYILICLSKICKMSLIISDVKVILSCHVVILIPLNHFWCEMLSAVR